MFPSARRGDRRADAVPGNQPAGGPIGQAQEIRVPVLEEHVEVTKTPVVKEEVTISKKRNRAPSRCRPTSRKEELKVDKQGSPNVREERR